MTKSDRNSEAPEGKGRGNATSKSNGHSTTDAPTAQGQRVIRPFDNSGWFNIHNAVFDVIMPRLSPNAFKVLCVAIRQTLGWRAPYSDDPKVRKQWDRIAYSDFRERAGIASDATVKRALDECLEAGFLLRRQPLGGDGEPKTWRGKPVYEYSLNRACEVIMAGETERATSTRTVGLGTMATETVEVMATETVEVEAPMATETVEPNRQVSNTKTTDNDAVADDPLTGKRQRAFEALQEIGVRPSKVAGQYAREHDPDVVLSWVEHVQSRSDLRNPAGYLRTVLDAGEAPPAPSEPEAPAANPWWSGGNNTTVNRLVEETLQGLEGSEPPRVVVERLAGLGPLAELVKASLRERGVELPEPEATGGDR